MAPKDTTGGTEVRVTRVIAAPRERVFNAFLETEAIKVWFAPSPLVWVEPPIADPRPGGRYSFTVEEGGKRWHIHGVYREIKRPERLVFTWQWENDPVRGETGDSVVTVELFERGGKTEVLLTHAMLPSAAARKDHTEGWERCLADIANLVAQRRS